MGGAKGEVSIGGAEGGWGGCVGEGGDGAVGCVVPISPGPERHPSGAP